MAIDCLKDLNIPSVDGNESKYVTSELFDSTMKQVEQNFTQLLDLIGKMTVPRYNTFEMHFGEIHFAVTGDKEQFDDISKYMNTMCKKIVHLIKDKTLESCHEIDSKKVVKFDEKGYN